MAVYREAYSALDLIESRAQQVFKDAADYGAPVRKGDDLWNAIKQLHDWYRDKSSTTQKDKQRGHFHIEIMDEWAFSDGRKTEEEATEVYRISYHKLNRFAKHPELCFPFKGAHGFVSVEKINR